MGVAHWLGEASPAGPGAARRHACYRGEGAGENKRKMNFFPSEKDPKILQKKPTIRTCSTYVSFDHFVVGTSA
jgi:hypothetical protein